MIYKSRSQVIECFQNAQWLCYFLLFGKYARASISGRHLVYPLLLPVSPSSGPEGHYSTKTLQDTATFALAATSSQNILLAIFIL